MRWGITDVAMLSNLSTNMCLNEIQNCKKTSMGPYFIV